MNDTNTMTEREELICNISDDYKSLFGVRPRGYNWDGMTVEELRTWHNEICESLHREMERERKEELAHETAVAKAMEHKSGFTISELVNW